MTVLALRLAGPMQSWGSASRFVRRTTEIAPTKSGVIGLIAAAQGRRRTDEIEDLLQLKFAIRIDQPGTMVRDFQTAIPAKGKPLPLSYRFYLGDAIFLALLEAETELLEGIADSIRNPTFPLYLGRRACPPAGPLVIGLRDAPIEDILRTEPWQAARWHRRKLGDPAEIALMTVVDCDPRDAEAETLHDNPISFDPQRREYRWRSVLRRQEILINRVVQRPSDSHDPMNAL